MADIAMQLHIEADADTVYAAISTTEGIEGWLTTTATAGEGVDGLRRLQFPDAPEPWRLRTTEAGPGKRLDLEGENSLWTGAQQAYEVLSRPMGRHRAVHPQRLPFRRRRLPRLHLRLGDEVPAAQGLRRDRQARSVLHRLLPLGEANS
ncbi:hypothetical protein [Streptomyces sp. 7N604]|uniref:hypothetical protein n=1 Tax=Streptomyces sp. 7N604 TaxID=3457415 RepID=UPI003FD54145